MSWIDQFRQRASHEPNGHQQRPTSFWGEFVGAGQGYAHTALQREADDVRNAPQGQRNHTLNRAAFSVGQLVAGGALTEDVARAALLDAARTAGLGRVESERTIASGLRGGSTTPRGVPERPGGGLFLPGAHTTVTVTATITEESDENAEVRAHLPRLDWEALYAGEDTTDWIVEPLIPARRLVALYSAPKVGKSLLMLELAVQISRGGSVLGVEPGTPRRVLYVDFENDPRGDILERLRAMGFGPKDLDGLDYLSFPNLAALDTAQGGKQLAAATRVYGTNVVMVDTISRAIAGEENENDTWLNFYRHTGRLMKAAGIALVRLDHSGKDETRGQRGGSAKSGDVDMVWRMSRVTDDTYRLDCEASRLQVAEKTLVLHRDTTPLLRHRVDAMGRYAAWDARVVEVMALADSAGLDRAIGRVKLRQWLRETGRSAPDRVLEEVCRRRKGIDDGQR